MYKIVEIQIRNVENELENCNFLCLFYHYAHQVESFLVENVPPNLYISQATDHQSC